MEEEKKTKVCPKCGRELPIEAFGKHARTKDGLQPTCKDCQGKARAEAWAKKNGVPSVEQAEQAEQKRIVVRDSLTDEQMVALLREHGWDVICTKVVEL